MLLIPYIIVLCLNTGGTKQCFVVLRNSETATLAQHLSLPRENIAFNEQSNCGFRKNIFWGQKEYPVLRFFSESCNCVFPREEVQEGHLRGKFQPSSVAQI